MQLSVIQQEYKDMVDRNVVFDIRGCSMFARGREFPRREFPIAMAKHIGIRPRTFDHGLLEKAWKKV